MAKCPNCKNELVKIIYGLPSSELFEQSKQKKVYLSGCEIIDGIKNPIYHCYHCNRDYYKDLKHYIITKADKNISSEVPDFLNH
jgi:hypothetical protein